ncbi:MAG: HD domain-containing protein [Candidatus Obscuribacterales bacterium]|nr:HD domain-containing protein [Candidatus Obscuribacterales bacterium]
MSQDLAELKAVLCSADPAAGINGWLDNGRLAAVVPEMMALRSELGEQDPVWHPEGNAYVHTLKVVGNLAGSHFVLMLAGLLHDIAKPRTQKRWPEGGISNHGHDVLGAEMARVICRRLLVSDEETERVCELIRLHMKMHKVNKLSDDELAELLKRPDIGDLITLQHADSQGTDHPNRANHSRKAFLQEKLKN